MDRLDMQTEDLVQDNIAKIEGLFPNCVTEYVNEKGKVVKKVDLDMLARELQYEPVAEGSERYAFNWPDKFKTIREMKARKKKMLRPIKEKSVDFDSTKNLYIEGDNLDAMKILRSHYLNKIKLIYIDPPYNTGEDFVYRDNFTIGPEEYKSMSGEYDEDGNKFQSNTGKDGRIHTNWLNMMYSRLCLAKDLLSEDGAIFISIDDSEQANLKKICDEIFNSNNFVDTIVWEKRYSPQNAVQWFSESHDFILVYAKNKMKWFPNLLERSEEMDARYKNPDNDPRGPWKAVDSTAQAGHGTKSQFYVFKAPNGKEHHLPSGRCWLYTEDEMQKKIADNRVWFGPTGNNVPAIKRFLSEVKQGIACQTIWKYTEVGHNQEGKKELKDLFPELLPFDTPKPTRLLDRIIKLATDKNSIVLDFFSGSATTAHSVFKANAADYGNRQFIMIQYNAKPEVEEVASHYPTICDVGEERIRRAAKAIKKEYPLTTIDLGFRALKVDDTCVEDVYYAPKDLHRSDLKRTVSYFKPLSERSLLDRLFQALPEYDLPFSVEVSEEMINGKKVFIVNKGFLIACLETGVKIDTICEIANRHPDNALFCNDSMDDDSVAYNCSQRFAQLSPNTHLRIM